MSRFKDKVPFKEAKDCCNLFLIKCNKLMVQGKIEADFYKNTF